MDGALESSQTELSAALQRVASVVEAALDALLPPEEGAEARLVKAMRYATLGGGKRMRAFLVIEGGRQFQQHHEVRILHLTGVIRPADIGGDNSIQSGFIADLRLRYDGKGPESNAMNQGWGARIMNVLWPF